MIEFDNCTLHVPAGISSPPPPPAAGVGASGASVASSSPSSVPGGLATVVPADTSSGGIIRTHELVKGIKKVKKMKKNRRSVVVMVDHKNE
ncbi:hypothetical protein GCK72_021346 [Caenorhabditis remanei]|uniref:Uncharacterized protein n=1 Tax=Caenorhabditis remanei TaxID=31234 RepID=A0A6A5GJV3_CAERE|nr:hypothetical protein GCK72_021346 [Caenorhabditis remanei]KAF1754782.1 hypothetical protein GCK72_021346 [Caenorhabditis remanei]